MGAADDVVDEVAHLPRVAPSRVVELVGLHAEERTLRVELNALERFSVTIWRSCRQGRLDGAWT